MEKGFKTTAKRAVSAPQVPRRRGWSRPGASSLQQTAVEATTQATYLADPLAQCMRDGDDIYTQLMQIRAKNKSKK